MGLLDFFARKKALSATPAVLETMAAGQFNPYPVIGGTNLTGQRISGAYVKVQNASYSWVYLYSPAVRRTVDYIARNISQLGLKCYERISDDEREHRGDHPGAKALRNPNPQSPGNYFIQEFVKSHLVYGNAYALKLRPSPGGPLTLVALNPGRVGIVGQSHFQADAYRIYRMDGTFRDVSPQDILRWPATTGDDPRHGESYLETLRELLAADAAAQRAVTELHRSGLALPGWIERPIDAPEWSEEGRQRFQEGFANQARDSTRHYPVLEEGMEFKQGGVTPEDAEFIAGRRLSFELVATQFGMKNVPPEGEEERKQFYADVLPPLCEGLTGFFDLNILKDEYNADDHYFEFNLDEKLIGDDRLKALTSAAGVPPLTRNEARARLNLPAKKGGDELITPLNVVVGDNPKPSVDVMPIQNPNKPPQDGSHRTEDVPTPPGKAFDEAKAKWEQNGNGLVKEVPLLPRRARTHHRRNRWASAEYAPVFTSHFSRQQQVLQSKGQKNAADPRWNEELSADLLEVSRRHLRAEGNHVAVGMASEFDPAQGENWLAAKATGAAEGVNQTTAKHIEEEGIAEAFTHALEARAGAAAMGYATDVASFADRVVLEQAPDGAKRIVTVDGGDCAICAEFQGSWPIADLPGWPSYHPGCNCVADIT